jgi:transketolase
MTHLLNYPLTETSQFQDVAQRIRRHVLRMVNTARSSHIGTAYSMADLLAVLYGSVLNIDPTQPDWPDRDRFILSKGHGCTALYASLAERGFFPLDWLETFYQNGSPLVGHTTHSHVPGVEVSTGSLGHGLSIASGMALAAQRDNRKHRVFVILSDGECDEGSTWEALLFAGHQKLDNLVAIVDYNKIQSLGRVEDVLDLEPMADKWRAARWAVREIDGHDITQIQDVFASLPFEPGKPNCVIAHTVKGKGVSFMENDLLWHYRSPDPDEYAKAMQELGE